MYYHNMGLFFIIKLGESCKKRKKYGFKGIETKENCERQVFFKTKMKMGEQTL